MLEYVVLFIAEYGVYIYGCVDEDVFSGARKGLHAAMCQFEFIMNANIFVFLNR